jgi:hypothetical protein
MAKNSDRRKHEKALTRRKRQNLQAQRRKGRAVALCYPRFQVITDSDWDGEFVDAVYAASKQITYGKSQGFADHIRHAFRVMATFGYEEALRRMRQAVRQGPTEIREHEQYPEIQMCSSINRALFELIPPAVRERCLPFNRFQVVPRGNILYLWVSVLSTARTPGGTIYYESRSPTVTINGEVKRFAFTTHALERICNRIGPNWKHDYSDAFDVCQFCHGVKTMETTTLYPDQAALLFFDSIGHKYNDAFDLYVRAILGEEELSEELSTEYRLGYCPVVVHGEFVIAKTLLLPGLKATPEFSLLLSARRDAAKVQNHLACAETLSNETLTTKEGIALLKYFHEHGVIQVRRRKISAAEKESEVLKGFRVLVKSE